MSKVKTFLETLTDPKKKKKKKEEEDKTPSPWEGKAGSYLEKPKDKKKKLDEAFE
jgi:hypothetical protein